MKDILFITDNAASQIKKIISKADDEVTGVIVGVDKSGCSGYAYKLDYAKDQNFENFEKHGSQIHISCRSLRIQSKTCFE